MVVNFLDDLSEVASCSLVSRLLYDISDPILYQKAGHPKLECILFWAAAIGRTVPLEKALRAGARADALIRTEYTGEEIRRKGPRFYLDNHLYDALYTTIMPADVVAWYSRAFCRWRPLHVAASAGHVKIVDLLLSHGASIDAPSNSFCACSMKFISYTRAGLAVSRPHWSPTHAASCFKQDSTTKLLLERGASVFTEQSIGHRPHKWTALHDACRSGSLTMAKLLVEDQFVAQIDILDEQHLSPLCYAYYHGHWDCFSFLLSNGADINRFFGLRIEQDEHFSILDDACETRRLGDALTLIDSGIDVKKSVTRLSTPLHRCLTMRTYDSRTTTLENDEQRIALIEKLLSCGVGINSKDISNRTPLHLAVKTGSEAIVNLLIDRGADIEAQDWNKETPLLAACCRENPSAPMMKLLLDKGAAIPDQTKAGSLLELLCQYPKFKTDKLGCVSLLLEHTMDPLSEKSPSSVQSQNIVLSCLSSGDGAVLDKILEYFAPPSLPSGRNHVLYYFSIILRRPNVRCLQFILDLDTKGHLVKRKESLWQTLDEIQDKELDKMGELLLDHGAECGRQGLSKESATHRALHRACFRNYTRIMSILLARGANPNAPIGQKRPLHEVVRFGAENEALQMLLDAGADVYVTDKPDYEYPLKSAITRNLLDKFEIMWSHSPLQDDMNGVLLDMIETSCTYGRFKILKAIQSQHKLEVDDILNENSVPFLQGLIRHLDTKSYWKTTEDMDEAIDLIDLLLKHDSERTALTSEWQWKEEVIVDNALDILEALLEGDNDYDDDRQWNSRSWCLNQRVTLNIDYEEAAQTIYISEERITFQNGIQDSTKHPIDLEYLAIAANFTPTGSMFDDSEMDLMMDELDWEEADMWDELMDVVDEDEIDADDGYGGLAAFF